MYDDDTGYDLSDPKHPTFFDRMADQADLARKREKEDAHEVGHQREQEKGAA